MREPTLREHAALSALLHLLVVFIIILIAKKAPHISLPPPYTVHLISPEDEIRSTAEIKEIKKTRQKKLTVKKETVAVKEEPGPAEKKSEVVEKPVSVKEQAPKPDTITVQERIAALQAKKRIERIVELRRSVLSVKKEKAEEKSKEEGQNARPAEEAASSQDGDSIIASYYSLIQERIWSEWIFPEVRSREGLEAVVEIRVLKSGRVVVQGISKSSGNHLFDRSTLRAIAKASPLPQPPYEMEIGLRFTP